MNIVWVRLWIPLYDLFVEIYAILEALQEVHSEQTLERDGRALVLNDAHKNFFLLDGTRPDIIYLSYIGPDESSSCHLGRNPSEML